MKRISLVLVVSACMLPAMAGEVKVHQWPTQYVPLEITTIDVQMDVGYYIHIKDQKPIKVVQDIDSGNPYHTYVGCKNTDVETNFACQLLVHASSTSDAGGNWNPSINPNLLSVGTTNVEICITGTNVKIEKLTGGTQNIKVAEIVVSVLPQ